MLRFSATEPGYVIGARVWEGRCEKKGVRQGGDPKRFFIIVH